MEKIVSLTICLILALHCFTGVVTLTCYQGVEGQRLIHVTCPGSCYGQRYVVDDHIWHTYGCTRVKQQYGCHTSVYSATCYCSRDLCVPGV